MDPLPRHATDLQERALSGLAPVVHPLRARRRQGLHSAHSRPRPASAEGISDGLLPRPLGRETLLQA